MLASIIAQYTFFLVINDMRAASLFKKSINNTDRGFRTRISQPSKIFSV